MSSFRDLRVFEGWDVQRMLDLYIHDYLIKNDRPQTAQIFARETDICGVLPHAIQSDEGFLTEWWSIFWPTYSSRNPFSWPMAGSLSSSSMQQVQAAAEAPAGVIDLYPNHMMMKQPGPQAGYKLVQHEQLNLPQKDLNPHPLVGTNEFDLANQWALFNNASAQAGGQDMAEMQGRAALAQANIQVVASSSKASSQQPQTLMMGERPQQQVSRKGNRHRVSKRPITGTARSKAGKKSKNVKSKNQHNPFSENQQQESSSLSENQQQESSKVSVVEQ